MFIEKHNATKKDRQEYLAPSKILFFDVTSGLIRKRQIYA